jgi:hypothetical protein
MSEIESLVNELEGILKSQLVLTKRGDCESDAFLSLTERANDIVAKLAADGVLKTDSFKQAVKPRIDELYQQLNLAVSSKKDSVEDELSKIRKAKKSVGAYRNNI